MTFYINYFLYYPGRRIAKYQKVRALDKIHAFRILYKWAKATFKNAKHIEIKKY